MLNAQKKYLTYLDELENSLRDSHLASELVDNLEIAPKSQSIKNYQLLVPVIGAFSSGKSSLINSFLESSVLPVGITPETALATELHYSESEHIEAIKVDGTIDKYDINQMDIVTKNADQYTSLKLFIKSAPIKAIEPLILVDMPGFDSPLESHNQAIMEYIDKGVHYIVLTSIEDGTITRSMERQLLDIKEYGRGFSFFVSKSNLRADSEVQEVVSMVEEQLEELFDEEIKVSSIDASGGKNLKKLLDNIEPEKLIQNIFERNLKRLQSKASDSVANTILAYKNDEKENEKAIDSLKHGLTEINKKKEGMISDIKEKYSNPKINRIAEAVSADISSAQDELATSYLRGGEDSFNKTMTEIVRHSLISNIKESITEISGYIVDDFSSSLKGLDTISSDLGINDEWINKTTGTVTELLNTGVDGLGKIIKDNSKHLGKTITTILAVTTSILNPVIELLIIFFADAIMGLFKDKKAEERQKKEKLKAVILTELVPNIKRKLKIELPTIFNQQVEQIITNISDSFQATINEKKDEIAFAEEQRKINITQIKEKISDLASTKENLDKLGTSVFTTII